VSAPFAPTVRLDLDVESGLVVIRPEGSLETSLFYAYRSALDGARWNPERRAHLAVVDKVPGILERLRDAGLRALCDEALVGHLAANDAVRWADLQAADERFDILDRELHAKNEALYGFQRPGVHALITRRTFVLADDPGMGKSVQALTAIPANAPVIIVCPMSMKGGWIKKEIPRWRPTLRPYRIASSLHWIWPLMGQVCVCNYDRLPDVHRPNCGSKRRLELASVAYARRVSAAVNGDAKDPRIADIPELVLLLKAEKKASERSTKRGHVRKAAVAYAKRVLRLVGGDLGHEKVRDNAELLELVRALREWEADRSCEGCRIPPGCLPGTVLIFDEAQYVKTASALRTRRLRGIAHEVRRRDGWTWALTGTPLQNYPPELWSIYRCAGVAEEAFGSYKEFVRVMGGTEGLWGGVEWGEPLPEAAERIKRVQLRRLKADYLKDLPSKTYQVMPVEIDRATLETCDKLLSEHGGIDAILKLVGEGKVAFEALSRVRAALATAKIPAMLEVVESYESAGEPLIVFSAHRAPIDTLRKRDGWRVITAEEDDKERTKIVADFQDGKLKGLGATIQAAGFGLTLTRASTELFVDQMYNPGQNAQAEDRCHRIGQKNAVLIKILAAEHPLDERVAELLVQKSKNIAASVDAARDRPQGDEDEEARDMRRALSREDIKTEPDTTP